MKFPDLATTDRRLLLGGALYTISIVVLMAGLFAVVSGLSGDDVHLPEEGSIEEILQDTSEEGEVSQGYLVPAQGGASPVPTGPQPSRLTVPKLSIDAPVEALGFVGDTNVPAVPDRAGLVAWYDFSPVPGVNNNAVFTGHVDWQTSRGAPIPGVFYRLRELQIGDEITVGLEDGGEAKYVVTGNVATKYDDPNVVRAMQSTSKDVITIITCGGSWVNDPSKDNGGTYTHRIVVRAERLSGAVSAAGGG